MFKLITRFVILTFLVDFASIQNLAAQVAGPVLRAQYPLEMEGERIVRLYDVSSNGQHGIISNHSNKASVDIFNSGSLMGSTDVKCVNKVSNADAYFTIPDPYKNYNINAEGYSISFWVCLNNGDAIKSTSSILNLPSLGINIVEVPNYGSYLEVTGVSNRNEKKVQITDPLTSKGWYFISVNFDDDDLFIDTYDISTYSQTPKAENLKRKQISNVLFNNIDTVKAGTGTILDGSFTGKIWNIAFRSRSMESFEVFNVLLDDFINIQNNTSSANPERHYVINNAFAYYPCTKGVDSRNAPLTYDVKHQRNVLPTSGSGTMFVSDRFGNLNASLQFEKNGYMEPLSPFKDINIGYAGQSYKLNPVQGFSISFWTKIESALLPNEYSALPFNQDDITYQFFYIKNKTTLLGGASLIKDKLICNRYIPGNPVKPWKLWFWDPVSFSRQTGWYHIVMVQKSNAMMVMVYKPDGTVGTQLNYFNTQDYLREGDITFGFGNPFPETPNPCISACKILDDIRIYNWPLSLTEAGLLHSFEDRAKPLHD